MKWQPIETAPKDGTPILVGPTKRMGICVASYDKDDDGLHRWLVDSLHGQSNIYTPTHWMPLPEPPTL